MSRFPYLITIAVLPVMSDGGDVPRKTPREVYEVLCTQSPFRRERELIPDERPKESPFAEWALGGVAGVGEARVVVLFHRKEADRQMIVDSSDLSGEFTVIEVRQDPDNYKETEVVMRGPGGTGTVSYDEKLLSSRPGVTAKAVPPRGRGSGQAAGAGVRSPRMRVVPQARKP